MIRPCRHDAAPLKVAALIATLALALPGGMSQANPHYPVTDQQRGTARQVAEAGVPLSELAPNAPDAHTVRPGDTLWDIARIFLRSPWRWPELWGMNLQQIANPHLIYPGQRLVLVRANGRARLQLAQDIGEPSTVRLSPRVRSVDEAMAAIPSIPDHLIRPFLNDAIVLADDELARAPTIVAGNDGRVIYGRGDIAYVRGDLGTRRDWRVFRAPRTLVDPDTGVVLGYEGEFVGVAEQLRGGEERILDEDRREIVPATIRLTQLRQEAGRGDRLAVAPPDEFGSYVPHAPATAIEGRVVSVYGGGVAAGQYQIVALNRGHADGLERGHVLALQRPGDVTRDPIHPDRAVLRLPDESHGHMMVFRVFERTAYALILSARHPVARGNPFTQP